MRTIQRACLVVLLAAALAWPGAVPSAADDEPSKRDRAEQMAQEAMERLMNALELFLGSIPQYEMPEVNENGDIIIRRKKRPEQDDSEDLDEPELDSTRT